MLMDDGRGGGYAAFTIPPRDDRRPPVDAVVAIPARDEAERIGACLDALAGQVGGGRFAVVLVMNNCRDGSLELVHRERRRWPFPIEINTVDLPAAQANAGHARRIAMDAAAAMLERDGRGGLILTTDADCRVDPRWLAANRAEIDAGVDGVAGLMRVDQGEADALPQIIKRRGRLERDYDQLLAELDARIDPLPHDPWPRHAAPSGASLAVTLDAYRAIGGLPAVAVGEDKALVDLLRRRDARVRHSNSVKVTVSLRQVGRAAGGMAETIRLRAADPEAPCDPGLEPASDAAWRARCRAWLRRLAAGGHVAQYDVWAPLMGLTAPEAERALATRWHGETWARIEAASPILRRQRLRPAALPAEIAAARRLLALLDAPRLSDGAARRSDRTAAAAA